MTSDIQILIKRPFSVFKSLTQSGIKPHYINIQRDILSISSKNTLEELVGETAKSLKKHFRYKLFSFVLQEDDGLHIWSDPLLNNDRLTEIVAGDFPGMNIACINYIGKRGSKVITTFFHKPESVKSYAFSHMNYQARLYLIHENRLSLSEKNASRNLIKAFGHTLRLVLQIKNLEKIVTLDPLTGCYNRRALKDILHHGINNAQRYRRDLSIVMLDIDHFKVINDTHGHLFGDTILQTMSSVIQSFIRQGDSIARYGGEEFVVVLPETPLNVAIEITERLKWKIENTPFKTPAKESINVTASYGVASVRMDDDTESLLSEADTMLYLAKSRGRNCVMPDRNLMRVKKI